MTTAHLPNTLDWDALLTQAHHATTADEANTLAALPDLGPHERRALFAWCRYPVKRAASKLNADPLLKALHITGWHHEPPDPEADEHLALLIAGIRNPIPWDDTDTDDTDDDHQPISPEVAAFLADPVLHGIDIDALLDRIIDNDDPPDTTIEHGWWPATITRDTDSRNPARTWLYLGTADGQHMATFTIDEPTDVAARQLRPGGTPTERAAEIVERQRIASLPGGVRRSSHGRPPSTETALANMRPGKRMIAACELVELEGWRQVDAAGYCNVNAQALNRALRRRRDERRHGTRP